MFSLGFRIANLQHALHKLLGQYASFLHSTCLDSPSFHCSTTLEHENIIISSNIYDCCLQVNSAHCEPRKFYIMLPLHKIINIGKVCVKDFR
jgi:hypothetical protein